MASNEPDREPIESEPRERAGLRARLWLGCLGGAVVALAGIWWAAAPLIAGGTLDASLIFTRLAAAAAASVVVAMILALWVDFGVVVALRRIASGLATREMPHDGGTEHAWGELGDLSGALAALLQRHRQLARQSADYEATREEIAAAREAVERWIREERWHPLQSQEPAVRDLADALNRGMSRRAVLEEQNREAARQIGTDLHGASADARESASQAERGFVEASALLTTVRELQRIGADLAAVLAARAAVRSDADPWRDRAVEVIQDLVRASSDSVESLGAGLVRVQEIADRVQVLSNRATLIALNVVVTDTPVPAADMTAELKTLARDVRDVTGQVETLGREVEERVAAASARMEDVRRTAVERLAGPPPAAPAPRTGDESDRMIERLRELVQESAATGERLSAAGERASSAAERLVRRLSESVSDLEGLVVRLSPPGSADHTGEGR